MSTAFFKYKKNTKFNLNALRMDADTHKMHCQAQRAIPKPELAQDRGTQLFETCIQLFFSDTICIVVEKQKFA